MRIAEPSEGSAPSWQALVRVEFFRFWSRRRLLAFAGVLALVLLAQFVCTAVYMHQPPMALPPRRPGPPRIGVVQSAPEDTGRRLLRLFMLSSPFARWAGGNHVRRSALPPSAAKIAAEIGRTAWHFLAPGVVARAVTGARRSGRAGDLRALGWASPYLLLLLAVACVGPLFVVTSGLQAPYYLTWPFPNRDGPLALFVLLNLRLIDAVWLVLLAAGFRRPWRALTASGFLLWVALPCVWQLWSEWIVRNLSARAHLMAVTAGPIWLLEVLMCITIWLFSWPNWVAEQPGGTAAIAN